MPPAQPSGFFTPTRTATYGCAPGFRSVSGTRRTRQPSNAVPQPSARRGTRFSMPRMPGCVSVVPGPAFSITCTFSATLETGTFSARAISPRSSPDR